MEVDVVERPAPDANAFTTITNNPLSNVGTTVNLTAAISSDASGWKLRIENEVMLVTAGGNTTTLTVTRGQDGTSNVSHALNSIAARVVGVQRVEPIDASRIVTYSGRVLAFRTPGRAGTAGAKILAIHNATGSPVKVRVNSIAIDLVATVIKAVTVLPPVVRAVKFTAIPTNGTGLTKVPQDSGLSSNSNVTVWGDASADGVLSGTQLAVTLPGGTAYAQEFAPRLITAVGYEMFDRTTFLDTEGEFITLNALEGVCVFLDYTLATQNPSTDNWIAQLEWEEYTLA
jgi:hypothetical protein